MRFRFAAIFYLVLVFVLPACAQWSPLDPVASVKQTPNGTALTFKSGGTLKFEICSDSIVHVIYSPTAVFPAVELSSAGAPGSPPPACRAVWPR